MKPLQYFSLNMNEGRLALTSHAPLGISSNISEQNGGYVRAERNVYLHIVPRRLTLQGTLAF